MNANELINGMKRFLGGQIIPLDDFHANDWIKYGLMTSEFRAYFLSDPNGESDLYVWSTRKVDDLINLRIYRR